jgi:hypothetical protein
MVVFDNYTMEQALERDKFYAAILFTSQGSPMLWQGQEFGFKSGWNDDNEDGDYDDEKLSYRPLDWSVLETEAGQNHYDYYKKLIMLRKNNFAFSKGEFYDLYRYSNQNVIVYGYKDERAEGDNDQVVVIANFSNSNQIIQNVPFLSSGNWYNFLEDGDDIYTSDGNYGEFSIDKKTAKIFTNKQQSLLVNQNAFPDRFHIFNAYPNPFNSSIEISFFTNEDVNGSLDIFDISGRLVRTFDFDKSDNGYISFKWNGYGDNLKEVPSGIYLVILKTDNFIVSNKISLIK